MTRATELWVRQQACMPVGFQVALLRAEHGLPTVAANDARVYWRRWL